jgi:hypothetical protein
MGGSGLPLGNGGAKKLSDVSGGEGPRALGAWGSEQSRMAA